CDPLRARRLSQEPGVPGRIRCRGPLSRGAAMTHRAKAQPEQLVLALPHRPAQEAEDFLVSQSNAAAVDLVDSWPGWARPAALVVGPAGAGKSHLANVWRLRSAAGVIAAARLDEAAVRAFEVRRALVVEDV